MRGNWGSGFSSAQFGSGTWACGGGCVRGIGSTSARVCGACLGSLSQASDSGGGEGAGGRLLGGPAGGGGACGVGDVLGWLGWPSLGARRERSSLAFFYGIHSGTVSLDKDRYLTPAPSLQGRGHLVAYGILDILPIVVPLGVPYFLGLFNCGVVFLPRWSPPGPLGVQGSHLDYWSRGVCFGVPLVCFL